MKKTIWLLIDNRAGSAGQLRGVAQALDSKRYEIIEKKIEYTCLAKLPNFLKGASLLGVNKIKSSDISYQFPDLVLSGSRRTAPVARWIKKQSHGKTKLLQLMRIQNFEAKDFDLVVVPEHDRRPRHPENFMFITGSPHRVTEKAMAEAKAKWESSFAHLPRPFTTVIIGGAIKGKPFSLENAKRLADEIKKIHTQTGGSILITDSKRTGEKAETFIMNELKGIPAYTYLWGEKKENPIMGFWACGDRILVTGDSVSMSCESCGSGKPVLIFTGEKWLTPKHLRFVQSLFDDGYAIACDAPDALDFKPQKRLDPAMFVAEAINQLFN